MKVPSDRPPPARVVTRNGQFQEWQALLANRSKRQRTGEFLVHGVRPITLAAKAGWRLTALIHDDSRPLSRWAGGLLRSSGAAPVAMTPELLRELGDKTDEVPELVAVVRRPEDDLTRIRPSDDLLVVVFDRPTSPGNIGSLIRSADAFGAAGVVVTGHAADVYDPKSVRASTGSLFAIPVVRVASHKEVLDWVARLRGEQSIAMQVVGTDEKGTVDAAAHDFTGPTLVLVGNETDGLSVAWRQSCDRLVRIPMSGSSAASSLNAAASATVILYEAARQRAAVRR